MPSKFLEATYPDRLESRYGIKEIPEDVVESSIISVPEGDASWPERNQL